MQTSEEVSEKLTGLLVPMNRERNFTTALGKGVQKLPKYLDFRKKNMVTSVKDQVRDHVVHTSSTVTQQVLLH